jgi:hypothetical protein
MSVDLTDDEKKALQIQEQAEMFQSEHQRWALLAEHCDHGPSAQVAENFRDTYKDLLEDLAEESAELDVDGEELSEKLQGVQPNGLN